MRFLWSSKSVSGTGIPSSYLFPPSSWALWALKVGGVEHQRWEGWGTIGFEGS